MVGDTGTYLDSPNHRYADGIDLADLPLERFADLDAVVVRTAGSRSRVVDVGALAALDVTGKAVLLHTGGDRHWARPPTPRTHRPQRMPGGHRRRPVSRSWSTSPASTSCRPPVPGSPPRPRGWRRSEPFPFAHTRRCREAARRRTSVT
jgi:Putative cyclase